MRAKPVARVALVVEDEYIAQYDPADISTTSSR
jgi:hypothetical protein